MELRLFDEKRQRIAPGDRIVFKDESDEKKSFSTLVTGLYRYESFERAAEDLPPDALGFPLLDCQGIASVMEEFYPLSKQLAGGVLAIRIKRL